MKTFIIIMFFVLQSILGLAQDMVVTYEGKSMESNILNQSVKYSIILPNGYLESKKSYPVVYLLHGLGGNDSSWLEYGRLGQHVEAAVNNNQIQPMIYVMPEGYRTYYVNDFYRKFMYQDMFVNELVPFIDTHYRTIPNSKKRATMGFSMGGFGALILPLKHPEVFSVSVPLSISIRTDDQYITENPNEWDEQWGRLFGGIGLTGKERLTPYYKNNNPFYLFNSSNLNQFKDLKLFIDNGDDEQTLSKSNEELHMLLRDLNINHEFRVRNGGHTFDYWRESLTNGLHFIDDAFNQKPYRGDVKNDNVNLSELAETSPKLIKNKGYDVVLPHDYTTSFRYYPVIYFVGKFDNPTKQAISNRISYETVSNKFPPIVTVFFNSDEVTSLDSLLLNVNKAYRVRDNRRFKSIIGYKEGAKLALDYVVKTNSFTSCAVFDAPLDVEVFNALTDDGEKTLKATWFFIATTDKSSNYKQNGLTHIILKDKNIYHEYRVDEGHGSIQWFLNELPNALDFSQKKIHY